MLPCFVHYIVCDNKRVVVSLENGNVVACEDIYTFHKLQGQISETITDMNEDHLLILFETDQTILDKTTGTKLYEDVVPLEITEIRMIKMIENTAVFCDYQVNIIKNENQEEAEGWTVNNFNDANLLRL